jgi:hypothetical protein
MEQMNLEKLNMEVLALKAQFNTIQKFIKDFEFAQRTEEAWKEIDDGKCTEYGSVEEFFDSLKNEN